MSGSQQIRLNGHEVWAYVVELDDGLRIKLALDDWERAKFYQGQRVPVKRFERREERLFVESITEVPPVAWIMLAKRMRVAG